MSSNKKYACIVPLTIVYSGVWFALLFIIVGFFMPTPVRFYRKLNGTSVRKPSSSDALDIDEIGMYDMLDD